MSLVQGQTLQEKFASLSEDEAQAVCQELRSMVDTWRSIVQNESDSYIGSFGKRKLNDILIRDRPKLKGQFLGLDAVQKFEETCGIDVQDSWPISFTHNDLCPPNILLSHGPNPKVIAIMIGASPAGILHIGNIVKQEELGSLMGTLILSCKSFGIQNISRW